MNEFHFNPRNVARPWVEIIPLLLLSFLAVSFVAAGDPPKTLGSGGSKSPTAMGDWVQAGFDSAHSGFNRFETQINRGNVGNLTQLWASPVGTGVLYASPVVCNGKVYIGSGDGRMYAFDAATGATLWVGPQQNLFFVDSAAVSHGLVFASSLYSTFLAYNAGHRRNRLDLPASRTCARPRPFRAGRSMSAVSTGGSPHWMRRPARPSWSTKENVASSIRHQSLMAVAFSDANRRHFDGVRRAKWRTTLEQTRVRCRDARRRPWDVVL